MSNGNLYPPQAFTREMLSQAFVWLQAQPDSVRELAKNPETLISIYLKTQRSQLFNQKKLESQNSNPYADAPVTAQNFMTDLKSLAEGLKQFEDPAAQSLPLVPQQEQYIAQPSPTVQPRSEVRNEVRSEVRSEIHQPKNNAHAAQVSAEKTSQLNSNSQCMIREVKEKLNLSSDLETLNMLVAIAYKNLKSLID